jgi:hemolysin D
VIVLAALTAVAWACLSQINIITTAPGRIVPIGRSKIVQPFLAGIVQSILVNDGDHVQSGQILIVLDPTSTKADALRISEDLIQDELDQSRLEGLRAVMDTSNTPVLIDCPPGATPDERAAANAQMQAQALEQAGKLSDLDQQIAEKRYEAQQAVANIAKVQTDKPFLEQVAGMRTTLLHDAVGSKLDWLTAEEQLADTGPEIALARAQQSAALAEVASLENSRAQTQAEYAKGILSDLEQADQKIGESSQDLIKATQQVGLTTLTAPISGTVQQLSIHTLGGVVSPGQALLTIVPDNQQMVVEASVKNQDIGFIHIGQEAQVKVGAFDFTRFGAIDGTIVSISRDVVDLTPAAPPESDGYAQGADQPTQNQADTANNSNSQPQEPEYVVHIALAKTTIMTDAGPAELQPGMGVTADIKTGRRAIISYLLSPFAHQIDEAGHER